MKVSQEFPCEDRCKIQIADKRKNGNSSWAEKTENTESSVRLAWYNDNGGFDPISSAELPIWGLLELIKVTAKEDLMERDELAEVIGYLTASLYRQL